MHQTLQKDKSNFFIANEPIACLKSRESSTETSESIKDMHKRILSCKNGRKLVLQNEKVLKEFLFLVYINVCNYTTYIQTIQRRYHGEQKAMTTP